MIGDPTRTQFVELPVDAVKMTRNWFPAHARYWQMIGLTNDPPPPAGSVRFQVYGPISLQERYTVVAIPRRRPTAPPRPVPA